MNKIHAKQKGAALMLFILFFLVGSSALVFALSGTIYSDLYKYRLLTDSKQSYFAADAGVEDVAYRFVQTLSVDTQEIITLGGATATTSYIYDGTNDKNDIVGEAVLHDAYRSSAMELYLGSGASFNFGVQSGNGGFELTNGSSVVGNVFSNGTIEKTGGGTATIYGDVISAGPTGHILEVIATGTARARVIEDSTISGDAYAYTLHGGLTEGDAYIYEKISGPVINGSEYAHQPEEATTTMPISDADIDAIKQDIIDTGTVIASTDPECAGGEYFTDDNITLGFVKIECDLRIKKKGSATILTLTGSLWVEGDITFEGGIEVEVDASVGNRTVPVIADNESNRSTSSKIIVANSTTFTGSGSPKSYVLLISQNDSAENALGTTAISLSQTTGGDLLVYASHGSIVMGNSISLKEVTGYHISLGNSAEIIYESGLVNLLFTSGPGGGFTIGGWGETY